MPGSRGRPGLARRPAAADSACSGGGALSGRSGCLRWRWCRLGLEPWLAGRGCAARRRSVTRARSRGLLADRRRARESRHRPNWVIVNAVRAAHPSPETGDANLSDRCEDCARPRDDRRSTKPTPGWDPWVRWRGSAAARRRRRCGRWQGLPHLTLRPLTGAAALTLRPVTGAAAGSGRGGQRSGAPSGASASSTAPRSSGSRAPRWTAHGHRPRSRTRSPATAPSSSSRACSRAACSTRSSIACSRATALWRLVDELASSPAVTGAITQQGLGFADQVGDVARARSRTADDWLERRARRLSSWRSKSAPAGRSPAQAGEAVSAQPEPADLRGAGFRACRHRPSAGSISGGAGGISADAHSLRGSDHPRGRVRARCGGDQRRRDRRRGRSRADSVAGARGKRPRSPSSSRIGAVAYALWGMGYFVGFWSGTGQTPGSRVMQIRVVAVEGEPIKPRRALVRCIGLLLAALPLFAGLPDDPVQPTAAWAAGLHGPHGRGRGAAALGRGRPARAAAPPPHCRGRRGWPQARP